MDVGTVMAGEKTDEMLQVAAAGSHFFRPNFGRGGGTKYAII